MHIFGRLLTFVLLRDAFAVSALPIDAYNDCNIYWHFIVSLIIE